jgi:hypothetical protein
MSLIPAPTPQVPCPLPPPFASQGTVTPWTLSEWETGFACGIADPTKFNFIFKVLVGQIICMQQQIDALKPISGGVTP